MSGVLQTHPHPRTSLYSAWHELDRDPTYVRCRLRILWRSRLDTRGYAEWLEDTLVGSPTRRFCNIVWFSLDFVEGTPLRFSPAMVDVFCSDWAARKVCRAEIFAIFPEVPMAGIDFVGQRRGPPQIGSMTLASPSPPMRRSWLPAGLIPADRDRARRLRSPCGTAAWMSQTSSPYRSSSNRSMSTEG
jgi:hypothetical protein